MSRLRLRATDCEDLKVIAAMAQDALVPVSEISYLADEQRFLLALNRFCWESATVKEGVYTRTNSGVCFEGVSKACLRGFDLMQRGLILDLLTITYEDGAALLHFAGHCDIRLSAPQLLCRLDDFGEPWPTRVKPLHDSVIPVL